MSIQGAQNLRLSPNKGLEVVNGRDLAVKVNIATMQMDNAGVGVKNGGIASAQLEASLASIQNDTLKRGYWSQVSNAFNLGIQQPASLPDNLFTGKVAGGAVNGNGTVGVVSASFAGVEAETGTDAGQGGLGSAASADHPYNAADFPGQRGILVVLHKTDGDDVLLSDILSTAAGDDINARVYGYLSYRSDLAADAHWRLWLYYKRAADGLETPVTPDIALNGVAVHVAVVDLASNLPVRSSLGIFSPAGQAAAAVGPKSIGTTELDDGAVTGVKLANDSVGASKLSDDAVVTSKVQDGAITGAKLQDEAVSSAKLANDSVGTAKLAADSVTSSKIKMRRRFQRVIGNAANGSTLNLNRAIVAGREEAVVVTEDNAFIDYVSANPGVNPSKQFTVGGNTITLGFNQVQDAVYRIWADSEEN